MNDLMVIGCIVVYLMIGIFVVSLTCGSSDDTPLWFIWVWPIILACLLLMFIVWIPYKVGDIIRDWWEERHS